MLDKTPSDILILIYGHLNAKHLASLALTCNNTYQSYVEYKQYYMKVKAGNTYLYPHQVKMLNWIVENLKSNCRLLCRAYMSAGKTLVAYEACRILLEEKKRKFALIVVPPTVIGVWISEAKKHYPHLVTIKDIQKRGILFNHSMRSADDKYIEGHNDLGGKIVVATPTSMSVHIVHGASYVIFDEAHRMIRSYAVIYGAIPNRPCLLLTASTCTNAQIPVTDELIVRLNESKFPKLSYEIIMVPSRSESELFDAVRRHLRTVKDTHVSLVTTTRRIPHTLGDFIRVRQVIDYNKRSVLAYRKFEREGGILLTSLKVISEGNNLNVCSLVYIVEPNKCTMQTLQQCVGRFYRESNINSEVTIVYIIPQAYDRLWARCRLSITRFFGFDAKTTERIDVINQYLKQRGYDINKFTDMEILCLYADNMDDNINIDDLQITLTNIRAQDFMRCMLV